VAPRTEPAEPTIELKKYLKGMGIASIPMALIALFMAFVPVSSSDDSYGNYQVVAPPATLAAGPLLQDEAVILFPRIIKQVESTQELLARSSIQLRVVTTSAIPEGMDAFAQKTMKEWNLGADSKGALLAFAPAFGEVRFLCNPALQASFDTAKGRQIVEESMKSWLSQNDHNGAVLASVEKLAQALSPETAEPAHDWDPNLTDSIDFRNTMPERPVTVPSSDAMPEPVKETSPISAVLFFLLAPLLTLVGWEAVVHARLRWLLFPIGVTYVYYFYSASLGIFTGILWFFGLVAMTVVIHGKSMSSDS
jgi:uncharacterized membrane protein YgcG